jgi:hypothetical protein
VITFLAVLGGLLLLVLGKVVVSILSKEVEGRLDQVSYAILRLARRRLPAELRETMHDQEWVPELNYITTELEERPITRLVLGLRYSTGLLRAARKTAREAGAPTRWARWREAQATAFAVRGMRLKICVFFMNLTVVYFLVVLGLLLGAGATAALLGGPVPALMADIALTMIPGMPVLMIVSGRVFRVTGGMAATDQHRQLKRAQRQR